jgi:chemotaxis protein methyltransferase CheR
MTTDVHGELSNRDFGRLAQLIESHCGIKMPPAKKLMVEGRLRRRVRALALRDVGEYCAFVFDRGGLDQEIVHLVDVVTTNKTDFFREPEHFDVLAQQAAPAMLQDGIGLSRPLRVWSAACSTGQEPYTLAMVLAEVAAGLRGYKFSIRATDICSEVLEVALRAVYPAEHVEPVPAEMRKRYLMRSRDPHAHQVRVVPELRSTVSFRRLNLIEGAYPWDAPMDITFCRNVLIYFDRPTQFRVLDFLCRNLRPGGWLFLGHSETLSGMALPLRPILPAVYLRE